MSSSEGKLPHHQSSFPHRSRTRQAALVHVCKDYTTDEKYRKQRSCVRHVRIVNFSLFLEVCVVGSAICGVIMVFLVGFSGYFFNNTVMDMLLVYGGQDFSLWGIAAGALSKLLVSLGF